MRALVIGATGFLGLNLVDALLAQGTEVRATRRRRSITAYLRRRSVELVPASLEDEPALIEAMTGIDVAFLTGAHYPRYSTDRDASLQTGVQQIRVACAAARATGTRLIYTSSVGALSHPKDGGPACERDIAPEAPEDSVYRATKWAMERQVEAEVAAGTDVVTLLPGACIGPLDVRVGTSGLLLGAVNGSLPWWVDGIVNVVDVADVADAHIAAAARAPTGARYCVAGHDVRLGELLRRITARFGGHVPRDPISAQEARARADADERDAEPRRERVAFPRELVDLIADGQPVSSERASIELSTTFRPLTESLDRAWAWFVRHRYLRVPAGREGMQ